MKSLQLPPYVVLEITKEVIFFVPKKSILNKDISSWMKKLNLSDYKGMVINSKCIFNRLKDQDCK